MTQKGKCDVCRQRKVKCDEVHPICGRCERSHRECTYNYSTTSRFVDGSKKVKTKVKATDSATSQVEGRVGEPQRTGLNVHDDEGSRLLLSLRKSRAARLGGGAFQTYSPHWLPLPREPSNNSTTLFRKWTHFLESISEGYDTLYALGAWMPAVAKRVGHVEAVDLALDCFLKSIVASSTKTPANYAIADVASAKALRSIRAALTSDTVTSDALLAVSLVYQVEVFVGARIKNMLVHQEGMISLLQRFSKQGTQMDDITEGLVGWGMNFEFFLAVYKGRDTVFDKPSWEPSFRQTWWPSTGSMPCRAENAQIYVCKTWTLIPRLIRLVRQARETPGDHASLSVATAMLWDLYKDHCDKDFEELLEKDIIRIVPTSNAACLTVVEQSFQFTSYSAWSVFLHYWTNRSVLFGLILSLLETHPGVAFVYPFDEAVIIEQDIQTAKYIAMCSEYSSQSPSLFPLNSFRLLWPLSFTLGAWIRLEERSESGIPNAAEAEHAKRMQNLWFELLTLWGGHWAVKYSLDELKFRHQVFMARIPPPYFPENSWARLQDDS